MNAGSSTHLVLIPSYNPGRKVFETVRGARAHWNPVWVVVDGSTDGTAEQLFSMAAEDPGLRVFLRPRNSGKGAAVLYGLRAALALGFTHALTMDSDGQHPAERIPAFMAASLAAPTLFVIAKDLREMQVDTSVAEADVGKLSTGMAATFTVDAFPGERFRGKVRQIRNAPTTLQNVVTYDAVIDVANPDLKLRPGMTANITFIAAEREGVVRVPNAALRFRPTPEIFTALGIPVPAGVRDAGNRAGAPGGGTGAGGGAHSGVAASGGGAGPGGPAGARPHGAGHGDTPTDRRSAWALRDGKPQMVPLRVGLSDGNMTEVLEGDLREGEAVIVDASAADGQAAGAPPTGPGGMRRLF